MSLNEIIDILKILGFEESNYKYSIYKPKYNFTYLEYDFIYCDDDSFTFTYKYTMLFSSVKQISFKENIIKFKKFLFCIFKKELRKYKVISLLN